MNIAEWFKAWMHRRQWPIQAQLEHLRINNQQDCRWLANDAKASAICERYADMLAEDWMKRGVQSISAFRKAIGCEPQYGPVDIPDEEDDDYSVPVALPDNRVVKMRKRDLHDDDQIVFDPPGCFASSHRAQRELNAEIEAAGGIDAWRATNSKGHQVGAPEVWDMWLCESVSCSLHPGVLYRFKVDPTCPKCTTMAHEHDNRLCPEQCALSAKTSAELTDADLPTPGIRKVAYMDGVDWQHHVEHDSHGVSVYPDVKSVLKREPCSKGCGVVRISMTEIDWPIEQNRELMIADESHDLASSVQSDAKILEIALDQAYALLNRIAAEPVGKLPAELFIAARQLLSPRFPMSFGYGKPLPGRRLP